MFFFKDHDEILEEIIKCDTSLTQLREMNKNHLNELLERCRIDYYQQIIKNKIENVNKEVYKMFSPCYNNIKIKIKVYVIFR